VASPQVVNTKVIIMNTFLHPITIIGPSGEVTLEALVGTGAPYTQIPSHILESLAVAPSFERTFILPDGSEKEYYMADVRMRLLDKELQSLCVFGDSDIRTVIGFVTLETLGLGIDLVNKKLIPVPARAPSPRLVEETRGHAPTAAGQG